VFCRVLRQWQYFSRPNLAHGADRDHSNHSNTNDAGANRANGHQ
jgi:hypothetical protein